MLRGTARPRGGKPAGRRAYFRALAAVLRAATGGFAEYVMAMAGESAARQADAGLAVKVAIALGTMALTFKLVGAW